MQHLPFPIVSASARQGLGAALLALTLSPVVAGAAPPTGSLRVFRETASANPYAFSELARGFDNGILSASKGFTGSELTLGLAEGGFKLNSAIQVLGRGDRPGGSRARISEAYFTQKQGPWQFGGGRRVLDWGVGFGFRPNDLIMEEATRPLSPTTRQGKYLVQVDHYGSSVTTSLAWVNPHRWDGAAARRRPDQESAIVGQLYQRVGELDVYGFGRYGRQTGSSAGFAVVGVPTDSLTLQASLRYLRAYSALIESGAFDALALQQPWTQAMRRNVPLATLGASWAGNSKQSVIVEYWYDARALSDDQWATWQQRGVFLHQAADAWRAGALPGVPFNLLAANLAWQEIPMDRLNQRRDSVLVRLAWQPENYSLSFDTVYSPADRGRVHTLSAQWRQEELQVNAAVRWLAGPRESVSRQLPTGNEGLLSAQWNF